MTDLEKTIDQTENTEVTTTSGAGDDFNLDFSDSLPQETPQVESNPSEDSSLSEDISSPNMNEGTPSPNLSEENTLSNTTEDIPSTPSEDTSPNLAEDIPSPDLSENVSSPDLNENIQSNNLTDNESATPNVSTENTQPDLTNYQEETDNKEISLGEINDEGINKVSAEEVNDSPISSVNTPLEQPTLLEQPSINENPLAENPINTDSQEQEQGKNKPTPKEKLAQLVKAHETKAQKNGFIKGILSGIAVTTIIVLVGFIFAKDQIFDLINKIDGNNQQLTANVVDIANTTDEENLPEDEDINNEEITIEDEDIYTEDELDEDFINEENIYEDEIIIDEDEAIDEENIEDSEDYLEDYLYAEEDIQLENSEEQPYTIAYVNSEEDANWVLPSHCSDLTCYGEDKEFTPCTTFRLTPNLDENANRIGKNGACKYKDSSELVYVEVK